jgi:hypothetical protein
MIRENGITQVIIAGKMELINQSELTKRIGLYFKKVSYNEPSTSPQKHGIQWLPPVAEANLMRKALSLNKVILDTIMKYTIIMLLNLSFQKRRVCINLPSYKILFFYRKLLFNLRDFLGEKR